MAPVPWDSVVTINRALCQAQNAEPLTNPAGVETAQRLWDAAVNRSMTVRDAFDVCRQTHKAGPFVFNNGNTFAAVGHTLAETLLRSLPPVEAQILRTTIGHYICGLIGNGELQQVMKHVEPLLERATPTSAATTQSPAPTPTPSVPLGLPRQQEA
jgi:hypothetical protein